MAYMTKERKVREVTEHLWKWIDKFVKEENEIALARHLRYAVRWKIPVEIGDGYITVGGRVFELDDDMNSLSDYYKQAVEEAKNEKKRKIS